MLDIRFVRENSEAVRDACRRKRIEADVDQVLALDGRLRDLKTAFERGKADQNRRSKEIPGLQGAGKAEALAAMKELSAAVKGMEAELKAVEEQFRLEMLKLPNIPGPEVPAGESEADNREIRRVGIPREFDFEPEDHVAIGQRLDLLDTDRAARIAGSRTYFLKNEGALLELAVLRMAMDHMVAKGFTPMLVPNLVRTEAMEGTAYLPGGEEQAYRTVKDDSWLIGTAEVPITAYYMGEILDEAQLPVLMAGWSNCYRREAGTYGRDTRGLYRIHQFQKVEQVVLCRNDPEESRLWHERILRNSEEILEMLGLPYRVVNVCDGDLGRPQIQKFDIETWMPSRNGYGETHSASRFHDFQARRLNLRYRDGDGRVHFCHTLNNTVVASPRILIPVLEHYQQADGSVEIPLALRPYLSGRDRIAPRP